MKNAVIYDRFAHKIEDIELKYRENLLRDFAKDKGYQIKKSFTDNGYSGRNFERTNFKEMITYIKENDINVIVVKSLDRISRNISDIAEFIAKIKRFNIEIDVMDFVEKSYS